MPVGSLFLKGNKAFSTCRKYASGRLSWCVLFPLLHCRQPCIVIFLFFIPKAVSLLLMHSNIMGKNILSCTMHRNFILMLHLVGEKGQIKKSQSLLLWRTVFQQLIALLESDTTSRGKTNGHRGSIILQHQQATALYPWLYSSFFSPLPQLVQVQVCICDSI